MLAFRARIVSASAVASRLDALAWNIEYWNGAVSGGGTVAPRAATNALDTPPTSPHFARNASARLNLASLFGRGLMTTNTVYTYGVKTVPAGCPRR